MFQNRSNITRGFLLEIVIFLISVLISIPSFSQIKFEKGQIPIRNFSYKEYGAMPQNFEIMQDNRDLIYIANNTFVLEFDGEEWRKIPIGDELKVKSLDIGPKGFIYAGARGDYGYLKTDYLGTLNFESLVFSDSIKQIMSSIETIYNIDSMIFFQERYLLFIYDLNEKTTLLSKFPGKFTNTLIIDSNVYFFSLELGLFKYNLVKNTIDEITNFPFLKDYIPQSFLEFTKDSFLIITEHNGIFKCSKDFTGSQFSSLVSKFLRSSRLINGVILDENKISIGTSDKGLVIMETNGNLISFINRNNGLQNNFIENQFQDNQNNLWLALNNGISKVRINNPISVFNESHELESTIEAITKFQNQIFVATHQGVYYMKSQQEAGGNLDNFKPKFIKLEGDKLATQCWDLLPLSIDNEELLLAISNNGIHEIDKNHNSTFILPCEAYTLKLSKKDPRRIYIGVGDGLRSIYYKNRQWIDEGMVNKVNQTIFRMEEVGNKLWLGSRSDNFVYELDIETLDEKLEVTRINRLDTSNRLPDGTVISVNYFQNSFIFGTDNGLYNFDRKTNIFIKNPELNKLLDYDASYIHYLSQGKDRSLWCIAHNKKEDKYDIGYFKKDSLGNTQWFNKPFKAMEDELIHAIYHDDNGITWLGGVHGLYRYDSKIENDYSQSFPTSIRKVVIGKDSLIFYGAYSNTSGNIIQKQPTHFIPTLEYAFNSLHFTFASQDYISEERKTYSYMLKGFDKDWSDWQRENKKEYTNLPEGNYIFMVKGKNMYDVLSDPAAYEFTILPPWYRTWWAYIIFFGLTIGSILTFTYLYNANLRKIITERTIEVVEQKEIVEEINKDIISSIDYAKKIQQAILPSEERMMNELQKSFVFFKPRDIVSGDFYWMLRKNEYSWLCVADCTGHGVPGAFMSILGTALLNEVVKNKEIEVPSEILDATREGVIKSLGQKDGSTQKDGMDASICRFNHNTKVMDYAGANNSIYIIRATKTQLKINTKSEIDIRELKSETHTLFEIKANKMPIGYLTGEEEIFTNHSIQLEKEDTVYLFTDGFPDQFGGPKGKKYKYKPFKTFLLSIVNQPIEKQSILLAKEFSEWSSSHDQLDDICIIGSKV